MLLILLLAVSPVAASESEFFQPLVEFQSSSPWPLPPAPVSACVDPAGEVLSRARVFLARGSGFELAVEAPLAHLERPGYRVRYDGGGLTLTDHPARLSPRATSREGIPEFWDEATGLSFFVMRVTTYALAGYVTRWEGPRPVEQADYRIIPADLSGLKPLAQVLLRRSGFGVGRAERLLPIDTRFSFRERVPFWMRTPRRPHYQATVLFDGQPVAEIVIDNDASPGTILSVTPSSLPWVEFERTIWSNFPYR